MNEIISESPETSVTVLHEQIRKKIINRRWIAILILLGLFGTTTLWQLRRQISAGSELRRLAERSASNAQLSRAADLINHHPADTERILSQIRPEYRDIAWKLLQYRLRAKTLVLSGHRDNIAGLAFSPEASSLASVDSSGTIKLWDTKSGTELRTLFQTHYELTDRETFNSDDPDVVASKRLGSFLPRSPLRYSADGRYLAILMQPASANSHESLPSEMFVFDLRSDVPVHRFDRVTDFDFAPGQSHVALNSDRSIKICRLETSEEVSITMPDDFGGIVDIEYRSDGKSLVVASSRNRFMEITADGGAASSKFLGQIEGFHDSRCLLAPGATRVAILGNLAEEDSSREVHANEKATLAVYDEQLNLLTKLATDAGHLSLFKWLHDDSTLEVRVGSFEQLLRLDAGELKPLQALDTESERIEVTGRPSDGVLVQTRIQKRGGSPTLTVDAQDSKKGTLLASWHRRQMSNYDTTVISANEQAIATVDDSMKIHLWNLYNTDEISWMESGLSSEIIDLVFSEDEAEFCAIDRSGRVAIWDLASQQTQFRSVLPITSGEWVAHGNADSGYVLVFPELIRRGRLYVIPESCYVWDARNSRKVLNGLSVESANQWRLEEAPCLSADGKTLAMKDFNNSVLIWDVDSSKERLRISVPGTLRNAVYSDHGNLLTLAYEYGGNVLREWNTSDGRLISSHTLRGITTSARACYVRRACHDFRYVTLEINDEKYWYDLQEGFGVRADFVTPAGEICRVDRNQRKLLTTTPFGTLSAVPLATDGVTFQWFGQTMVSLNADGTFSLWDAGRGEEQLRFATGVERVNFLMPSPARTALVLTSKSGKVAVMKMMASP